MPYLEPASYELPFQGASDTSRAAAVKARDFVGRQGMIVLRWFAARGQQGGTQAEASTALGIGRPSICARVRALEQRGELVKTDRRHGGCAIYTIKET